MNEGEIFLKYHIKCKLWMKDVTDERPSQLWTYLKQLRKRPEKKIQA